MSPAVTVCPPQKAWPGLFFGSGMPLGLNFASLMAIAGGSFNLVRWPVSVVAYVSFVPDVIAFQHKQRL